VALLVIEHQIHIQNLITRVNYDVRTLLDNHGGEGRLPDPELSVVDSIIEPLVSAMFMVNEAVLTDKISGSTDFREKFAARGPFDDHGRSLRHFDLET